MFGLPKMNSLRISKIEIEHEPQPINLTFNYKDLYINNMKYLISKNTLYGYQMIIIVDSYFKLNYCSYNSANYSMSIESEVRKSIILEGLYEIDGRVLIFPFLKKDGVRLVKV